MLASRRPPLNLARVPAKKLSRRAENMIAQMSGLPEDESRSRPRETRSLGELVDRLLHKHHVGVKTPEDAIRDAWTGIVGAANATFCTPLRIERERVLVVGVSNPVVRQELLFHKALVLQRVKAIPACTHIGDIVLRAG